MEKPQQLEDQQRWVKSLCGCRGGDYGWDWSWVDQVYCINLRYRVDRFLEAQCEFHRVGLCDKLLFYRPDRPTEQEWAKHQQHLTDTHNHDMIMTVTKGAYGCWQSHKAVTDHALKHGFKRILVFEDDIAFLSSLTKTVVQHDIPDAIGDLPKDADFLHLGYFPIRGLPVIHSGKSAFGKLWSVKALCTVAYVATLKGMHTIQDAEMSLPIDFWMIKHSSQYALYPKIAWQRKSATDIDELWLGCPSNYVKELGNYVYRNNHGMIDTLMLVLVPLVLVLLLVLFLAYAIHITKHFLLPHIQNQLSSPPPSLSSPSITPSPQQSPSLQPSLQPRSRYVVYV
jgi:GR25 family glycosyltransferase involved in LPS biosynthesis